MSFTVSPGVSVREVDLTTVVRSAASTDGGFAGMFTWGPVNDVTLVSSEEDLVNTFGSPDGDSFIDFFVAASFLAYTDKLRLVRIGNTTDMANASDSGSGSVVILNDDDYETQEGTLSSDAWIGKYPGDLGNSVAVATCSTAAEFSTALPGSWTFTRGSKTVTYTPDVAETLSEYFNVGDYLQVDGTRYAVASVDSGTQLTLARVYSGAAVPTTINRLWRFAPQFGGAPGTDELHVVVLDEDGEFTSVAGTILETYEALSTVAGTLYPDGSAAYYKTAINRNSDFLRVGDVDPATLNATNKIELVSLSAGADGNDQFGTDEYMDGYDFFADAESVDVSLLMAGAADATIANYLIENISEVRKDVMTFISPEKADVVNNSGSEVEDVVEFRNTITASSYAVMDSGWKYMYDKYNDVYRWVPLNGDIAGLCARTDRVRDAWYSPAGFNRGNVKNVVKLAFSPSQAERDDLYTNAVNPVVNFPGQGVVLFGDKTLLAKPSAFDRINVRRLFIILEKSIANASKFTLFEFNDEFTRAQFVSLVEPFLREIKGRRGIQDFRVVADTSVNTPQVINNNQFVGQIYVKPNYSINFIRLDFVAVRTGVSFDEVAGAA